MATGARGEAILEAEGESYPILFTNRAIFEAERATGKAVLEIINMLSTQSLSMGALVQLLLIGLEHGRRDARQNNRPHTLNDAWNIIDVVGFRAVLAAVFEALAAVLSYSQVTGDESPPEE